MGRVIIKYAFIFVVLVLVQVLILNQVQFSGYINPYIYVLFIMLLPLSSPRYVILVMAFLMGMAIDIFSGSLGVHAFATVFVAYFRVYIIRLITNREEDQNDYPGLAQNGFSWFLSYTIWVVLVHHFVLFYIEVFTLKEFLNTFYRIVLSSVSSIFVIVLSQFIIFRE
jgi:rod shape-determining protein MreD